MKLNTKVYCFNSCMVQLKSSELTPEDKNIISFNSCMVQLK